MNIFDDDFDVNLLSEEHEKKLKSGTKVKINIKGCSFSYRHNHAMANGIIGHLDEEQDVIGTVVSSNADNSYEYSLNLDRDLRTKVDHAHKFMVLFDGLIEVTYPDNSRSTKQNGIFTTYELTIIE